MIACSPPRRIRISRVESSSSRSAPAPSARLPKRTAAGAKASVQPSRVPRWSRQASAPGVPRRPSGAPGRAARKLAPRSRRAARVWARAARAKGGGREEGQHPPAFAGERAEVLRPAERGEPGQRRGAVVTGGVARRAQDEGGAEQGGAQAPGEAGALGELGGGGGGGREEQAGGAEGEPVGEGPPQALAAERGRGDEGHGEVGGHGGEQGCGERGAAAHHGRGEPSPDGRSPPRPGCAGRPGAGSSRR